MAKNLREYLRDTQRVQDDADERGLAEWVEKSYRDMENSIRVGAGFARFSQDGQWVESRVPVPIATWQYNEWRLAVELLRRRFIMDGWVRSTVDRHEEAPNPVLVLSAPVETVMVETIDGEHITPEINDGESVGDAVSRFLGSGTVYYRTPMEQVTVPSHQISRVIRRYWYAPGCGI